MFLDPTICNFDDVESGTSEQLKFDAVIQTIIGGTQTMSSERLCSSRWQVIADHYCVVKRRPNPQTGMEQFDAKTRRSIMIRRLEIRFAGTGGNLACHEGTSLTCTV